MTKTSTSGLLRLLDAYQAADAAMLGVLNQPRTQLGDGWPLIRREIERLARRMEELAGRLTAVDRNDPTVFDDVAAFEDWQLTLAGFYSRQGLDDAAASVLGVLAAPVPPHLRRPRQAAA